VWRGVWWNRKEESITALLPHHLPKDGLQGLELRALCHGLTSGMFSFEVFLARSREG
jgi:hypothetical protein